jgi:hypothetical protein
VHPSNLLNCRKLRRKKQEHSSYLFVVLLSKHRISHLLVDVLTEARYKLFLATTPPAPANKPFGIGIILGQQSMHIRYFTFVAQ